jgi:hypothetical protein
MRDLASRIKQKDAPVKPVVFYTRTPHTGQKEGEMTPQKADKQ